MSREIKAVCVVAKPPRHNPQSGGVLVPVRFRYKVRDYTKGCEYHAADRGTEHVLVSGGLVPVIYPLRPGDVFGVAGVEMLVVWADTAKRRHCVTVIHALEVILSNGAASPTNRRKRLRGFVHSLPLSPIQTSITTRLLPGCARLCATRALTGVLTTGKRP